MSSQSEPLSKKTFIFLSHGSPDARSALRMNEFSKLIGEKLGYAIHSAFLDHNEPSLATVAMQVQESSAYVLPMLLSNAFHARKDVPKAVKEAGLQNLLSPIGHPPQVLQNLLLRANQPSLFIAVGTTNSCAQAAFEIAVQSASWGTGIPAAHAYVTGKKDLLPTQLDTFKARGGGVVIPWMFAEGKLMDVLLRECAQRDISVEGRGLCLEEIFVEHLVERLSNIDTLT